MPDSSASLGPRGIDALPHLQEARATGLFSPDQACAYLSITYDQLLELVRTARLRALRNPAGQLCFAKDDLDAIPIGIAPEVALAELNQKEPNVLDASMALPEEMTSAWNSTSGINLDVLMATIDELRRTNARSPQWLDIDAAVACYGVPAKILKSWAGEGFVRKSKLGPALQSKALYNAADINDCLCRIAAGKNPVSAMRKGA
jgi:excisionase family DNA binding protein